MADLDAELLALAGDSSDDEGSKPTQVNPKPNSTHSSSASPVANINEVSADKSYGASTHTPKHTAQENGIDNKPTKKDKMNDSEEEGEA